MKKSDMLVHEAIAKLDALFSSQDPVVYKKNHICPDTLSYKIDEMRYARNVKIQFYGIAPYDKTNTVKLLKGTLLSMVNERQRTRKFS